MLEGKGVAFVELCVDESEAVFAAMIERTEGRRTVPQIFIDGGHPGGMDTMQALARAGALDTRIGLETPRGRQGAARPLGHPRRLPGADP